MKHFYTSGGFGLESGGFLQSCTPEPGAELWPPLSSLKADVMTAFEWPVSPLHIGVC